MFFTLEAALQIVDINSSGVTLLNAMLLAGIVEREEQRANEVFKKTEAGTATILIPDIVVAEFIYIGLKGGRLKASDPTAIIAELLSATMGAECFVPLLGCCFNRIDEWPP